MPRGTTPPGGTRGQRDRQQPPPRLTPAYQPATSRAPTAGTTRTTRVTTERAGPRQYQQGYAPATSRAAGSGRTTYNVIRRPGGVLDPRDFPNRTGQVGYTPATSYAPGAYRTGVQNVAGGYQGYAYQPATSGAAGKYANASRRGRIITEEAPPTAMGEQLGQGFLQGVMDERAQREEILRLLQDPEFMAEINRRPPRQNYNFGGPGTNAYEPPLAPPYEPYPYDDGGGGWEDWGGWGGGGGGGGGGWDPWQSTPDPYWAALTQWRIGQ